MHRRSYSMLRVHAAGVALTLVAVLGMCPLRAQIEHLDPAALDTFVQALSAREQQAEGRLQAHLLKVAAASHLAIANAVRVADDVAQNGNSADALACYAVPALSDRMRLADAYPADGALGDPVRIIATPGEFEPASFVVYPFADYGKSTFTVGPLRRDDGRTLPATALDLRVVKVWYQNGNGWISYFMDTGLQLTPELLLHDEDLVSVDTIGKANYARVKTPDGSFRQHWITPPKSLDSIYDERGKNYTFRPMKEDFEDADSLQPVALEAGTFKQFWLTVEVPADAEPGVYTGAIAVNGADNAKLAEIPVVLRVLPFTLPEPKTYFDADRDFLVSTYNYVSYDILLTENGNDFDLATQQYLAILKNMRRHNITTYKVRGQPSDDLRRQLELSREAGMGMDVIIGSTMRVGPDTTHEGLLTTHRLAQETRDFFLKHLGHINVYLQSGDEPSPAWIVAMRPHWQVYQDMGFKFYTAGWNALYHKAGYIHDMHPSGTFPEDAEQTRGWNAIGDAYVGWYASQHVGVENPAYIRKQYGLVPYRNNFSMVCNYSFSINPWNDLSKDTYKPMVFAYCTRGELVDTMAWEGFREGVDDIRYATLLQQLAIEARDSDHGTERRYAGRKALQYLADLDVTGGDMNAARLEIIDRILHLQSMR